MKIGLMRHFKPMVRPKWFMNAQEFRQWHVEKDKSGELFVYKTNLGNVSWQKCVSSDLARGVTTAKQVCKKSRVSLKLFREVPVAPVFEIRVKLPFILWIGLARLAWMTNHRSQPESMKQSCERLKKIINRLLQEKEDVLVVSHGLLMLLLKHALRRAGFKGNFFLPKYGKVYVFER